VVPVLGLGLSSPYRELRCLPSRYVWRVIAVNLWLTCSFPQLDHFKVLEFRLDRSLVHTVDQVKTLFEEVHRLADRVRQTPAGFRRAPYDSKPFKILLAALLRAFVDRCPLAPLYHMAVAVDVSLHDKCFRVVGDRLEQLLWRGMVLACKDKDGFVALLEAFVVPVLAKREHV
jgi:hypothetical protein